MKGIKMSDCRFYVNEEARTIVCVIPNTKHMLVDYIYEHFEFGEFKMWSALYVFNKLNMPNSFIGKAVCSEEDEWNEETGRLIAFSKAKNKCYQSFFKRANTFVQLVDRRLGDVIESFNNFGVKLSEKKEELEKQIEERLQKK